MTKVRVMRSDAKLKRRGANQSVDTRYAAALVRDAIVLLESGATQIAVLVLKKASGLLPECETREVEVSSQ